MRQNRDFLKGDKFEKVNKNTNSNVSINIYNICFMGSN